MKVVCAMPMERSVHYQAVQALLAIAQQGTPFLALPYMTTDRARNLFASKLLESEYTHLLMLDSDMLHPPDVVQRLARWVVRDPGIEIVGALYYRRGVPYDPCAYILDDTGVLRSIAQWPAGLIHVHAIGTGAILIARTVFERIPAPWFQYGYNGLEQSSEDIMFCGLAQKHGIKIWCDTSIEIPHLLESQVTAETFAKWKAEHGNETQAARSMAVYRPESVPAGSASARPDGRGVPGAQPGAERISTPTVSA